MGPLAAVERFLERLFERQTARLFRTAIRPVQVQRRLERAMEADRAREGSRIVVPHRFVIRLQPDDLAALRATTPEFAASLADSALAFARGHGYTLLDRPMVTLRPDPALATGDIEVDVADSDSPTPSASARAASGSGAHEGGDVARTGDGAPDLPAGPQPPAPSVPAVEHTAVFVVPGADGARATIREVRPDQSSRTVAFDGRPITIGRAPDNTLVVRDGRASRHHARIDARRGSLVLSDLGSTNGSYVNDRRVESIALGEGDRIRIGTTSLIIESLERAPATAPAAGPPDGSD